MHMTFKVLSQHEIVPSETAPFPLHTSTSQYLNQQVPNLLQVFYIQKWCLPGLSPLAPLRVKPEVKDSLRSCLILPSSRLFQRLPSIRVNRGLWSLLMTLSATFLPIFLMCGYEIEMKVVSLPSYLFLIHCHSGIPMKNALAFLITSFIFLHITS